MKSWLRLVGGGLILTATTVGAPTLAAAQADKDFSLPSLTTAATINADGSMDVLEQITYRFSGGPFSHGYRTFQPAWLDKILGFEARDGEQHLPVVAPALARRPNAWQFDFDQPGSGTRTFTLKYTVLGAVAVGPDVAELYWQFAGDDHPGIGAVQVRVRLPGSFAVAQPDTPETDTTVVRAWGHGPRDGQVQPSPDAVDLRATELNARTFFEGRIVIPRAGFTVAPMGAPRLSTILAEELAFQGKTQADADKGAFGRRLSSFLAPIASLGSLGALFALWRRKGKEYEPSFPMSDYWREPLTEPPAIIAAAQKWGATDGSALAGTLVDLAQRGYLTIEEQRTERFGPDTTVHVFHSTQPRGRPGFPLATPLESWEHDLLARVFRGQPTATSDQFTQDARDNRSEATTWWTSWKAAVVGAYEQRQLAERDRPIVGFVTSAIVVGLVGLGFLLRTISKDYQGRPSPWPWLCFGAAAATIASIGLLRRRTQRGADLMAKANGLRKFLKDFSSLDEAPIASLAVWERFLVDAVTLGVAADLTRGLAMKLPQIANDPGFAGWYVPLPGSDLGSSMTRFPTQWGSEAETAMKPESSSSSSGSGGGFSGGGGGGGGGGGFGAD